MASGVISKRISGWGNRVNATPPFTAPCDGLIYLYINPSSTSGGYARYTVGPTYLSTYTALGEGVSTCAPIMKGEEVSYSASINCNVELYFIPLQ